MRIVLIANMDNPSAVHATEELARWIPAHASGTSTHFLQTVSSQSLAELHPNLVVTLGGDGTILQTARFLLGQGAPVLGINFGKLGYLAAFSLEEFKDKIQDIASNRLPLTSRLMLHGAIYQQDMNTDNSVAAPTPKTVFECPALNDIVVNSGAPFRMIQLKVLIDSQSTASFRGDGLIVSTSSGSTGYNLSANGPLLSPDVPAMVVTPICPHSLSFRPVVISDHAVIRIEPGRVNEGTRVCFDGQVLQPLRSNEHVVIRRAAERLKLVENPVISHWQLLANKLHWAQSPRG